MYTALACTILPSISPTIYFHAHPVSGATLEQVTEIFLRFVASRWSPHDLPYVIAEDHPNIRLESLSHLRSESISMLPVPDRPRTRNTGPTGRFCYTRRRYHFRTISTEPGPSKFGLHLQALRTIGLLPRQLGNIRRDCLAGVSLWRPGVRSFNRQLVP